MKCILLFLCAFSGLKAGEETLSNKNLWDTYSKYTTPDGNGDKGTAHTYIDIYNEKITKDPCTLLEIGVSHGLSILMWLEYLPRSRIIGVDISKKLIRFNLSPAEIIEADATKKPFADLFPDSSIDYIIDDGSHEVFDQICSFELLFPKIKPGGIYFIEDVKESNLSLLLFYLDHTGSHYEVHNGHIAHNRKSIHDDDILFLIYAD